MTDTMQVTIMYRNNWPSIGGDGWTYHPMNVEISTKCPICGEPRGEPRSHTYREDGEWYTVNVWTNPCGHVDTYENAYLEWLWIRWSNELRDDYDYWAQKHFD